MANIEIKFKCESENGDFITVKEEVGEIILTFSDNIGFKNDVILDKSTAIKFAKTLRTEINKIES